MPIKEAISSYALIGGFKLMCVRSLLRMSSDSNVSGPRRRETEEKRRKRCKMEQQICEIRVTGVWRPVISYLTTTKLLRYSRTVVKLSSDKSSRSSHIKNDTTETCETVQPNCAPTFQLS
jgi:hypothetical protein